jgi:hypothetical protein
LLEFIDDKPNLPRPKKGAINNSRRRLPNLFILTRQPPQNPGGRMEQRDIDISFPENGKQATAG